MVNSVDENVEIEGLDELAPIHYLVSIFAAASIIFSIYLWLFQLTAIAYARYHFHRNIKDNLRTDVGVTILKPLCFPRIFPNNYDFSGLKSNLDTYFNLNYQTYEIYFCVKDHDDLSIDIIQELIQSYPHIKAKLLIGDEDIGINPKIRNMNKGYLLSNESYEYIWISDMGIKTHTDTLREMVSLITEDKNIGLVHQLPFTSELNKTSSLGNTIEMVYFGSQHGRIQICAHLLGQVCITGMSNLIRKSALEKSCGGLAGLSPFIAEDYFMTKKMESEGYSFRLSSFPALQNKSTVTIKSFFLRMRRWTRLRITMIPGVTCLEPFSEIIMSSIFASLAIKWWRPEVPSLIFMFTNISLWFISDIVLISAINNGAVKTSFFKVLYCWVLRECSTLYILISALFAKNTEWIGANYRINYGGKACNEEDNVLSK